MLQSLVKPFFARNPLDYSVEDNWKIFKDGLTEILHKRVPKKKLKWCPMDKKWSKKIAKEEKII